MSRWIVAGLIMLNIVLVIGVFMRLGGEKTALGQLGATRPDYAVVSGSNNGNTILYFLDTGSGRLFAATVDAINHRVNIAATKDVASDMKRLRN
jgi:hypothetical protein